MDYVVEQERKTPVIQTADVVVVGGGPSGLMAAVASARNGAKTVLVERQGFFGGMATAGLVLTLGGFNTWTESHERVIGGIPQEMVRRMVDLNGARDNSGAVLDFDPEVFKLVADEMVLEAGVTPFLHTMGVTPWMEGQSIRGVIIESKSGRHVIPAKVVIDATGDADIAARAGVPTEKADALQPATMCFRLRGVSQPLPVKAAPINTGDVDAVETDEFDEMPISEMEKWRKARWLIQNPLYNTPPNRFLGSKMEKGVGNGEFTKFEGPWCSGIYESEVWFNTAAQYIDGSDVRSFTEGEINGRRQVHNIVNFWKRNVDGFQSSRLLMTGTQISIRETRRIVGEYVLSGEDIVENRKVHDSIALGCWIVDVHPDKEGRRSDHHKKYRGYRPNPYQIPYGCLVPLNVDNLLTAGRCISTTREGMGSIRVMGTCMAIGQGAGTAAALAVEANVMPRNLDTAKLKSALRSQGAIIER
jgi:hypothetical protein